MQIIFQNNKAQEENKAFAWMNHYKEKENAHIPYHTCLMKRKIHNQQEKSSLSAFAAHTWKWAYFMEVSKK